MHSTVVVSICIFSLMLPVEFLGYLLHRFFHKGG